MAAFWIIETVDVFEQGIFCLIVGSALKLSDFLRLIVSSCRFNLTEGSLYFKETDPVYIVPFPKRSTVGMFKDFNEATIVFPF